jgi:hypothetical protein
MARYPQIADAVIHIEPPPPPDRPAAGGFGESRPVSAADDVTAEPTAVPRVSTKR